MYEGTIMKPIQREKAAGCAISEVHMELERVHIPTARDLEKHGESWRIRQSS
jgi:hypothetical protein